MPRVENKNKQATSKAIQELRSNTLENGLYFFLLDAEKNPNSDLSIYLNNTAISIDHSNQVKNNGRDAIFLNISETDFTQSLFAGTKRCHLTIDRNYYEFEGAKNPDRLKWHYCHYTEEYTESGYVLHVYFNSIGQTVGCSISSKSKNGQLSRELTTKEAEHISINIFFAADIIAALLILKRDKVEAESSSALRFYSNIRQALSLTDPDLDNLAMLNESYIQYNNARMSAQRYADTLLLFSNEQLCHELEQANHRTQTLLTDNELQVELTEAAPKNAADQIGKDISAMSARVDMILRASDLIAHANEIDNLQSQLIMMAKNLSSKNKRQVITLITKLEGIDISNIIATNISIEKVSLEYLMKNYYNIETSIQRSFFLDVINVAISGEDEQTRKKFQDICYFLFDHSCSYRDFIKQANIITNPRENQLGMLWLTQCFQRNVPSTFKMLLSHGINLGMNASTQPNDEEITYDSVFKVLTHKFCFFYINIKDMSKDNRIDNLRVQEILDRVQNFLSIMLLPEFMAGAEYEYNLRSRLNRATIKSRLNSQIAARRMVSNSRGRLQIAKNPNDIVANVGILSILDYVIAFGMPAEIVNLVASHIKADQVNLENVAINFGEIFSGNDFTIIINFDDTINVSNTRNKVTCFPMLEIDHISAMLEKMHDKIPSGNINPRIYITEQEHSGQETTEQLLRAHEILNNLNELLMAKMLNTIEQKGNKEIFQIAEKMLNIDTSSFFINQYSEHKATGKILGALVLLINLQSGKKEQISQLVLITRALLKLKQISEIRYPVISQLYAFSTYRLYLESKELADQSLFNAIELEIRKFNTPAKIKESADKYHVIPEASNRNDDPTKHTFKLKH